MNRCFISIALSFAGFISCFAGSFVMAKRGENANCDIVVSSDADECVKYAAKELQRYTKRMTGVNLRIINKDKKPSGQKVIVLDVKESMFESRDAFRLKTTDEKLFVIGGSSRGVLYGVYELLERFGGCDWFAPWCEKVPELKMFEVPSDLNFSDKPAFDARNASWRHVHTCRDRPSRDFAAKMRFNSSCESCYGGPGVKYAKGLAWDNAIGQIIPPKDFFEKHPEWYCEIEGRRVGVDWQPCCMSTGLVAFVAERVKDHFRAEPDADACSVAQMDNGRPCQCAACRACANENGSSSGPNIMFANAVADEVVKEFPGKMIVTFAYKHTRHAPTNVKPRDNVMVVFCSYECAFSGAFEKLNHANTKKFCKDLREWGRVCRNVRIYDYCVNFRNYLFPFPNITGFAPNYRLFRNSGTRWLFSQGGGDGFHSEFAELKCYLQSKLMWNPDQSEEPIIDRFLTGYYGTAAPFVKEYIKKLYAKFGLPVCDEDLDPLETPVWSGIYSENVPLTDEFIDESLAIWKKAELSVKDDPIRFYNVRMGELPLVYVRLKRLYEENSKSIWVAEDIVSHMKGQRKLQESAADLMKLLNEASAHKHGVALAEDWETRHVLLLNDFKALAEGVKLPESGSDCAMVSTNAMIYSGYNRTWRLPIRLIAADAGAKYKVRARFRPKESDELLIGDDNGSVVVGLDVEWLPNAKGTNRKRIAKEDISSEWAWYDVGEYDISALQKIPRPTMNGLCLIVKGNVELGKVEITKIKSE